MKKNKNILFVLKSGIFLASILFCMSTLSAWHVRATRFGDPDEIGKETANGHKLKENDWLVALPSGLVLDKNQDWSPRLRITKGNRSVIVPVWDIGPWNELDNYWNNWENDPSGTNRNTWGIDAVSLPTKPSQGIPEATASYVSPKWHYGHTISRTGYVNEQWIRIPYNPDTGDPGTQRFVDNGGPGIDIVNGTYASLNLNSSGVDISGVDWDFTTELPRVQRIVIQQDTKTVYDSQTGTSNPATVGTLTFKIIFTETMKIETLPIVNFGLISPYNQNFVGNGSWSQTTYENDTWTGTANITSANGDGIQTVSIYATDCGNNQIDKDENVSNGYQPDKDVLHSFIITTAPIFIQSHAVKEQGKISVNMTVAVNMDIDKVEVRKDSVSGEVVLSDETDYTGGHTYTVNNLSAGKYYVIVLDKTAVRTEKEWNKPISVLNEAPTGYTGAKPQITASAKTNINKTVSVESFTVESPAVDVDYKITPVRDMSVITGTPQNSLTNGVHTAKLKVKDTDGNTLEDRWQFKVSPYDAWFEMRGIAHAKPQYVEYEDNCAKGTLYLVWKEIPNSGGYRITRTAPDMYLYPIRTISMPDTEKNEIKIGDIYVRYFYNPNATKPSPEGSYDPAEPENYWYLLYRYVKSKQLFSDFKNWPLKYYNNGIQTADEMVPVEVAVVGTYEKIGSGSNAPHFPFQDLWTISAKSGGGSFTFSYSYYWNDYDIAAPNVYIVKPKWDWIAYQKWSVTTGLGDRYQW